jgi:DNA-binding CsgD family transcriptional regulator
VPRAPADFGAQADEDPVLEPLSRTRELVPLRLDPPSAGCAVPDARQARQAAIDASRASSASGSSDDARRALRGLVEGTWSVVDRFDADGERLFVARRNTAAETDLRRLTNREQQATALASRAASNKQIAYALGISVPSVATHLASGLRKLGLRNRAELVSLFSARTGRP